MEKRRLVYKKRRHHMNRNALFLGILLLLLMGTSAGVLAKYISSNEKRAEMLSSDFHFTSDYLEEAETGVAPIAYTVSDWTKGIHIQFFNYEKENIAQITTDEDITYKVSAAEDWKLFLDGVEIQPDTECTMPKSVEDAGGAFAGKAQKLTLKYTGTGNPNSLTVTAKTTSPYVKTLHATFTLSGAPSLDYIVADDTYHCKVIIHTNAYAGDVEVTWNAKKYSPDNTHALMGAWRDGSETGTGTFTAEAYTTYKLIFVENAEITPDTFKEEEITVREVIDG